MVLHKLLGDLVRDLVHVANHEASGRVVDAAAGASKPATASGAGADSPAVHTAARTVVTRTLKSGKYEGEWVKGVGPDGQGKLTSERGVYEGAFAHGRIAGRGTFTHTSGPRAGGRYVGEWGPNSKPHGTGTYWFPGGECFVGGFVAGVKSGAGTYYDKDGNIVYNGFYRDGKRHGLGEYTWPDGRRYVGEFKESQMDGHGKMFDLDGTVLVGLFKAGKGVDVKRVAAADADGAGADAGAGAGDAASGAGAGAGASKAGGETVASRHVPSVPVETATAVALGEGAPAVPFAPRATDTTTIDDEMGDDDYDAASAPAQSVLAALTPALKADLRVLSTAPWDFSAAAVAWALRVPIGDLTDLNYSPAAEAATAAAGADGAGAGAGAGRGADGAAAAAADGEGEASKGDGDDGGDGDAAGDDEDNNAAEGGVALMVPPVSDPPTRTARAIVARLMAAKALTANYDDGRIKLDAMTAAPSVGASVFAGNTDAAEDDTTSAPAASAAGTGTGAGADAHEDASTIPHTGTGGVPDPGAGAAVPADAADSDGVIRRFAVRSTVRSHLLDPDDPPSAEAAALDAAADFATACRLTRYYRALVWRAASDAIAGGGSQQLAGWRHLTADFSNTVWAIEHTVNDETDAAAFAALLRHGFPVFVRHFPLRLVLDASLASLRLLDGGTAPKAASAPPAPATTAGATTTTTTSSSSTELAKREHYTILHVALGGRLLHVEEFAQARMHRHAATEAAARCAELGGRHATQDMQVVAVLDGTLNADVAIVDAARARLSAAPASAITTPMVESRLAVAAALVRIRCKDYQGGMQRAVAALSEARRVGNVLHTMMALQAVATAMLALKVFAKAKPLAEECLRLAQLTGCKEAEATALLTLASVCAALRDAPTRNGMAIGEQAVAICKEQGLALMEVAAVTTVASSLSTQGEVDAALSILAQTFQGLRARGGVTHKHISMVALYASLLLRKKRVVEAVDLCHTALAMLEHAKDLVVAKDGDDDDGGESGAGGRDAGAADGAAGSGEAAFGKGTKDEAKGAEDASRGGGGDGPGPAEDPPEAASDEDADGGSGGGGSGSGGGGGGGDEGTPGVDATGISPADIARRMASTSGAMLLQEAQRASLTHVLAAAQIAAGDMAGALLSAQHCIQLYGWTYHAGAIHGHFKAGTPVAPIPIKVFSTLKDAARGATTAEPGARLYVLDAVLAQTLARNMTCTATASALAKAAILVTLGTPESKLGAIQLLESMVPHLHPIVARTTNRSAVAKSQHESAKKLLPLCEQRIAAYKRELGAYKAPVWEADSAAGCNGCAERFSMLRRRHHCRACGRVFCAACTAARAVLAPEYGAGAGAGAPVRVCDKCAVSLGVQKAE